MCWLVSEKLFVSLGALIKIVVNNADLVDFVGYILLYTQQIFCGIMRLPDSWPLY